MYVHVMAAAVPTKAKEDYLRHAHQAQAVFRDHGAVEFAEYWGDEVPPGETTSFPRAVKCNDDETVVVSWIGWASKDAASKGMEAVMSDPRMADAEMPFDGKRLIWGGFDVLPNAG